MEQNSFLKGLRDGIPICLGYLSVSFAFGIFSVESGLSILETLLISMANVTSAGQLAGVPIICSGGGLLQMAISQIVINLRYALMGVSLSQKFSPGIKTIDRFLISFVNTDEVFAVASSNEGQVGKKYMYGLILTPYLGWSFGTLVGAVAGNILPAIVISSLGVAIYGMFIAIVVPIAKESRAVALCSLLAVALGCIFKYVPILARVPQGFVIIVCAALASIVFALISPIPVKEEIK